MPALRGTLHATMGTCGLRALRQPICSPGSTQRPLQIIQVTLANDEPGLVTGAETVIDVRVDGPGVHTPGRRVTAPEPGGTLTAEVPVEFAAPCRPGSLRRVTAAAAAPRPGARRPAGTRRIPAPWRIWTPS